MKKRISLMIAASLLCPGIAGAQDATAAPDTTVDVTSILQEEDRGGLSITSGKTYNRVEGLPVLLGPTYRERIGSGHFSVSAFGILRSAQTFHWDAENIGHKISAELRYGGRRGFSFGGESFDVVAPMEPWQLTEPDAGLAAFFFKRDYFDYYSRHGARGYVSAFTAGGATVTASYGNERWSSRSARNVFTLLRDDENWRINPQVDDGVVHLAELAFNLDTRTSEINPWAGWFINASYEHGSGNLKPPLETGFAIPADLSYGRGFIDVRRYNRVSPKRQINARIVLGGWLNGDRLPLERRFSVGGIGTLPGFDFRRVGIGTDVGQCAEDGDTRTGRPAQCDRVALTQVEYRHELPSELFDVFNRNGFHVRGAVFRVKPTAVVFADAGRGWRVGDRKGTLTYPSGSLPAFDTFRTDVGAGLDLGIIGLYVAKAVSSSKEPANFFVRIRDRF
ncbi:MAG TPA: BamA/TamA family outer membrane protein [Gemmatimonadaceae bacterium]|nr:BamA/TamA family outer membrane protein [Gemmatimonadaceae bacterium]